MLRDKSNKRDKIRSNLLATLSKSGTAMAVPAVPVATALAMLGVHKIWKMNKRLIYSYKIVTYT